MIRASLLLALAVPAVASAVPMQLTHQGRLMDAQGQPYTGLNDLEVRIYNQAVGGQLQWSESQQLDFTDGYFVAELGNDVSNNPLEGELFDQGPLFVAIVVNGVESPERRPIHSVPYAIRASSAASVSGGTVDVDSIAINGTTVIDSSGTIVADIAGVTLDDLTCAADNIPLFSGTDWVCAPANQGGGVVTWDDITSKPSDFDDDIDNDALAALSCAEGQVPIYSASFGLWGCGDDIDTDTTLDEAAVDAFVANNGFVTDWANLPGIPAGFADNIDDDTQLTESDVDGFVANNGFALDSDLQIVASDLSSLDASLATVARTGSWNDLVSMPAGFADGIDNDTQLSESDVDTFVANNGFALDADIHTVGKTGSWDDLQNIPSGFADDVDDELSEAEVETFVTNAAIDLAAGSTVGGSPVLTQGDDGGSVYVRWGRSDCGSGDTRLYQGIMYNNSHGNSASGNPICLQSGDPGPSSTSSGDTLYPMSIDHNTGTPQNRTVTLRCAVCLAPASPCFTTWGTDVCPTNFSASYQGIGYGSHHSHGSKDRVCIDNSNETGLGNSGWYVYVSTVQADTPTIGGYPTNRAIKCAECCRQ